MQDEIQKLKQLQSKFNSNLSILQKTKDGFLSLFRAKLEEQKIEQIKGSLFDNNSSIK